MTVREAINMGYQEYDRKLQLGYIGRRTDVMERPVLTAGGNRKGELYYLEPSMHNTQYCYRVYIRKGEGYQRFSRLS